MSEINIPAEACAAGWTELMAARAANAELQQAYARALHAAAPLIVAAELERLAEALPMPASWDAGYQAGRYDAHQMLVNRAMQLKDGQ